jgi:hypothetical protein
MYDMFVEVVEPLPDADLLKLLNFKMSYVNPYYTDM